MSDEEDTSLLRADTATGAGAANADTATGADAATAAAPADVTFYGADGLHPSLAKMITEDMPGAASFFKKYETADNPTLEAIKGIENMQHMMGQKAIEKPADDAPDAVKQAYADHIIKQNNTPDAAEGYNFKRPEGLAEDIPFDDAESGEYAKILHKHHASPELAADLLAVYTQGLEGIPAAIAAEEQKYRTEQVDLLRNEHGVNAEKVIQAAKHTGNMLGASDDLISQIGMTAGGVNWLASLKGMISSDIISATKSGDSIMPGAGSNYLEKAKEAAGKATEALKAGNDAEYNKWAGEQTRLNKLHVMSQR